jgi:hypothetical protein
VKQALLFANARRSVPMKILVVDQSLSLGAIIAELERTASETTLPHKIPTPHQIIADKTSFGAYDFDIPLLSTIKKHCSGDPK